MRWLVRLTATVVLSGIAVGALTVAGWPRPRVVRIEATSQVVFNTDTSAPDAPYRLIQQNGAEDCYWFLAVDGALLGPWRPSRLLEMCGFDAAGRFVAHTPHDCYPAAGVLASKPYELVRYDPATAREEVVFARPDIAPFGVRLSRDLSTLAVATPGDPLTFVTYDVADGRQRDRVKIPGRVGGLDPRQNLVAACYWDLTPDGRGLVLAEAWSGSRRIGPQDVDLFDAASGRLKWRRDFVVSSPPDDGVSFFDFSTDGRSVLSGPVRREFLAMVGGAVVRLHVQRNDIETGESLPESPPESHWVAAHGGLTLSLRSLPTMLAPLEYRVTDSAGVAVADWRPLPGKFGRPDRAKQRYSRPGSSAVIYRSDEYNVPDARPWKLWLDNRLGRVTPGGFMTCHYLYHDYGTGEFRDFPRVEDGPQTHAVGPHDLAVLTFRPDGGTLTLYDLPPRRPPWPWSVPAGVAIGVLLTAVGVRLRGTVRTRLNRRAELMK